MLDAFLLFVRRAAFICRRQTIRGAVIKVINIHCQSNSFRSPVNGSSRAVAERGFTNTLTLFPFLVLLFTRCCGLTSSQPMETRDPHYVSGSESDADYAHRPPKRARRPSPSDRAGTNGRNATSSSVLPPLSLSILGVEPLDEFIREVADFIHHSITTRPAELQGDIEVEAKIGVLKERATGNRLQLPILVETSMIIVARRMHEIHYFCQFLLQNLLTVISNPTCPR